MDFFRSAIQHWHPGDWHPSVPIWVSVGGLSIGAITGLFALLFPKLTASMTHLQPNPGRPGAFAEFRATFGGLYFFSHGLALVFAVSWALGWGTIASMELKPLALGTSAACGAMWAGGALGRLASIFLDKTNTELNQLAVAVDLLIGVAIIYPWIMRAWL